MMISQPRTEVMFANAPRFSALGKDDEQTRLIESLAERWYDFYSRHTSVDTLNQLPVSINVTQSPLAHAGLGSGTQMAAAIGAGLSKYFLKTPLSPEELAQTMKRGKRSAIGSYGFSGGGFMIDRGKSDDHLLSPLDFHVNFPDWPVVVLRLQNEAGLSGPRELDAFAKVPPSSEQARENMLEMARNRIVPSLLAEDFEQFSQALYEYGRQSGMLFESIQGGPYNGSEIQQLVDTIRGLGVAGVGQSSWGPSVYAITRNMAESQQLVRSLNERYGSKIQTLITKADNHGVTFEDLESVQTF